MNLDVIQLFTPFFFVFIALEFFWLRRQGKAYYRLNDSIADLGTGVISQLAGVFYRVLIVACFAWVNQNWSLQVLVAGFPAVPDGNPFGGPGWPVNLLSWVLVFLAIDFAYYWAHRHCHEVNFLWATHVVHHSSEEYNLSVALRQSALQGLFTLFYYLPLAFIGVTWQMYVMCYGLNLIYQFFIHTRAVGKLHPWIEAVWNTPSHHRVHHGVNPKYQDKNYAGVFILWDRLFGTYQPEEEEVVYGITVPFRSWNPLWANLHVWKSMFRDAAHTQRWADKLKVFFAAPGWKPADLGPAIVPQEVSVDSFRKFDVPASRSLLAYAAVQFVAASLMGVVLLELAPKVGLWPLVGPAFYVVLTLNNLGGVLERRQWALWSEMARLLALPAVAAVGFGLGWGVPLWAVGVAAAFAGVALAWLWAVRAELTEPAEPQMATA